MEARQLFKFRVWKGDDPHMFIFVGNVNDKLHAVLNIITSGKTLKTTEKKLLQNKFGDEYENVLGIGIDVKKHYITMFINQDDNMNIVCKKLSICLEPYLGSIKTDDMYLWNTKNVKKTQSMNLAFINNCFKKEERIRYSYFKQCVGNYFGHILEDTGYNIIDKPIALKLLNSFETATVTEPMLFKYTYNGFFEYIQYDPTNKNASTQPFEEIKAFNITSHISLTLEAFDVGKNIIDIITYDTVSNADQRKVYFPSHGSYHLSFESQKAFIQQLDKVENDINNYVLTNKYNSNTYLTFLYIKANEININKGVNLSILFDKLHADTSIPFIKYKSTTNIYYKIHKKSLINIPTDNLYKWTQYNSSSNKYINTTNVSLKMNFGNISFCTLTIFDNLAFDIKYNLSIEDKVTFDMVTQFYVSINHVIRKIKALYPDSVVPNISTENIRIVNMVSYNVIGLEKKTVKFDNIADIINDKMYPYFNIIPNPDKKILHLQYKKVDNYIKYDNIQAFITMHFGAPKEVLLQKLMDSFVLSKEEAEKEYNKWASKNEVQFFYAGDVIKIKPKYDNFVNIKLKINEVIDSKFIITGLKDVNMLRRLVHLVHVLLDLTNLPIDTKETVDMQKFDEQMYLESSITEKVHFDDINQFQDTEETIELDDDNEYEIDQDFLDLEKEFEDTYLANNKADGDIKTPLAIHHKETNTPTKNSNSNKVKAPGPVLGILKSADKDLFEYNAIKGKKRQDYPSICGWSDRRQPMVITEEEKQRIDKEYPGAYDDFVHTGSTKDLAKRNIYICPKIWCPKSRIAMNYDQYNKNNKKCPYTDEEPILFNKSYWAKDDDEWVSSRPHHIGFLKPHTHTNHYCIPCCFKLKQLNKNKKGETCNTNYDTNKTSMQSQHTSKNDMETGNEKYIKGSNYFPVEEGRYGLLPNELNDILGGDKCGDRQDGTGLMQHDSKCFLRKGITHASQSFISCVTTLLGFDIQPDDFIAHAISILDIEKFISLENGKMIRLFVNTLFDIHNHKDFKEFKNWFLNQSTYISKFNLTKVRKDLESTQVEFFDKSRLTTYKDVIREFLIYNSYKHFIAFLKDKSAIKDHRTLLDLINIEHTILNPHKVHIIVIDVNTRNGEAVMLCPFNRNIKDFIDMNSNFVFCIKNNIYYEPLTHVEFNNGNIKPSFEFNFDTSQNIQKMVSYYINNCGFEAHDVWGESIGIFLESIGLKPRCYVVDFGFRIRGVLLRNNLYIPFPRKLDIYHVRNKSFIYYNDIVDFKCVLDKDEIQSIFKQLNSYTKSSHYKIKDFIDEDTKTVAVILESGTIIPLRLNRNSTTYLAFEHDLDIFIEHKENDKRTLLMEAIKENTHMFDVALQGITDFINNHDSLRFEVDFLTDQHNPFPKNYKRRKLMNIIKTVSEKVTIQSTDSDQAYEFVKDSCAIGSSNCIDPCNINTDSTWSKCLMGIPTNFMNKFIGRMIEALLLGTHHRSTIKHFSINQQELLLDQHDVNNNRINELIETQRDPYKLLSERLDNLTESYVFDKGIDIKTLTSVYVTDQSTYGKIPVVLRKSLNPKTVEIDFEILSTQNYNSTWLYSLFININDALNPKRHLTIEMLKSIIKTRIIHDYASTSIDIFFNNDNFTELSKKIYHPKTKITDAKLPLDVCLDVLDTMEYYPSLYETHILANLIGVNIIVVGRTTKKNPDGMNVYDNHSTYNIILFQSYDRLHKHDVFELFVKNRKQVIYKKKDLPSDFIRIVENKKKVFEIDVENTVKE